MVKCKISGLSSFKSQDPILGPYKINPNYKDLIQVFKIRYLQLKKWLTPQQYQLRTFSP